MTIKFLKGDVFDTGLYEGNNVVFAHCIGSDFGMFGGIATQFIEHFDMKQKLINWADREVGSLLNFVEFPDSYSDCNSSLPSHPTLIGKSVKIDTTYNLITKQWTSDRPTMSSLRSSLNSLKLQMLNHKELYLAIPDMIGCGIDGLDRSEVIEILHEIFYHTQITIYVVKF